MEAIKTYIFSLTGFSFISSLVCSLLPDIPAKRTVKFVCGIILSLLIISPLKNINPDFTDIITLPESYNLYSSDMGSINKVTREAISDKVSEVVTNCFNRHNIVDVQTEVVFDEECNILSIKINKYSQQAAKESSDLLGIPFEIIDMTE